MKNGQHNWAVSIGGAGGNTVRDSDFLSVIAEVSSERYKPQVLHLRKVRDAAASEGIDKGLSGDALLDFIKDATDELKRKIPAVLWSGTFTKRNAQSLKQHSGLVHVDLDKLGAATEGWRDQIIQDEHTLYCMVSPSGTGLKVVYKCDPEKPHIESFHAAEHHVLERFGLVADPSCKDVSRLCFLSWDPDAFHNPDAAPLPYPPPASEPDVHEPAPSSTHTGLKPGEDYDNRGDWKSVLRKYGWTDRGDHHWTRPGKTQGVSATWDMSLKHPKRLYVFTSSTPFLPDHHYRPWHIYAWLEHAGNYVAASKALYALQYGDRIKPKVTELDWDEEAQPNGTHAADQESKEKPSFKTHRRSIGDFKLVADGDRSILLGNRYLNRGDGAVLSGTSGIGKSSLALFMAVLWALGRPALGIKPNGCLRSLIFQSEDSDGDVAEVWASIVHCLKLTPTEEANARAMVEIVTDKVNRGLAFYKSLKDHLAEAKPDLVWINPLQAFAKGDITKGEVLGDFLREQLNSLNEPAAFGYIIVHHTTKPATGKDRAERLWHEVMYDMAGGAEIINWARAIMSLRPAEAEGTFNLVLAKRGRRANVTRVNPQGAGFRLDIITTIPIKHATGRLEAAGIPDGLPVIFWEEREPDVPKEKGDNKGGRPPAHDFNDYRDIFPPHDTKGLDFNPLFKILGRNGDIKRSSLQSALKRWEKDGQIERVSELGQVARFRVSAFISKPVKAPAEN